MKGEEPSIQVYIEQRIDLLYMKPAQVHTAATRRSGLGFLLYRFGNYLYAIIVQHQLYIASFASDPI